MANKHGLFWNSQNGDRVYDANDFSEWLKKFYTTGVFNGDLAVTASGGMTVSVSSGYVNIEGKVKFFSTPTTLTIATAGGTYERIDTVVAECNYSDREITVKVVTGAYSTSPKATAPVRTAAAYQLVLAQIDVPVGATEITQKNITDKRMDSNVCGLVTGTVSQIDFSTVKAQFDSWFDDVKGTLDSDAAGNLKNQIDAANEKIDTNANNIATNTSAIDTLNNNSIKNLKNQIDAANEKIDTLNSSLARLYPVGSIYLSTNSTNPATFIGGTWEQIKGRFLVGVGSVEANTTSYWGDVSAGSVNCPAGEKGGEARHTLTVNEMPSHSHNIVMFASEDGLSGKTLRDAQRGKPLAARQGEISELSSGMNLEQHIVVTGGGAAHNNMPPYLAVYMWKRTA